jgi:hypothetical protein
VLPVGKTFDDEGRPEPDRLRGLAIHSHAIAVWIELDTRGGRRDAERREHYVRATVPATTGER